MSQDDKPFDDREVAAFIDGLPRYLTYSEIRSALVRRFGENRAWSELAIVEYWTTRSPQRRRHLSRFDRDPELTAFVADRLDRLTLDDLAAACRERFGAERAPSRSALHRHAIRRRVMLWRMRNASPVDDRSKGR